MNVEAQDEAPAAAAPIPDAKPDGKAPVDFSKLPPEIRDEFEARFNSLYRNMKDYERRAGGAYSKVAEMQREIEAIKAQKASEVSDRAEADLKRQIADANARGQYEEAADLTGKLAQNAAAKMVPKLAPAPVAQPSSDTGLSQSEARKVNAWAATIDNDSGQFVRPWAQPNHPRQQEVIGMANEMMGDPEWREKGVESVLSEIDRRMTRQRSPSAAALSSDGAPGKSKSGLPKLTDQERRVAQKMGLKPEDYARAKAVGL